MAQPIAHYNKRDFFLAHTFRSNECLIKTTNRLTEEQILCIKLNGEKESRLHTNVNILTLKHGFNSTKGAVFAETDGSVGIGTANPGSWKLAVNGSIGSNEIKVETNWSDFVFYKNYRLRPLKDVERYIRSYQHLPHVPSATEVEKNGIKLGETNTLLLRKIEALTLYAIEGRKEISSF